MCGHRSDVIADQVHGPEGERMLSDIAEKIRINRSSLLQALETILGDSNSQFLQSLRLDLSVFQNYLIPLTFIKNPTKWLSLILQAISLL